MLRWLLEFMEADRIIETFYRFSGKRNDRKIGDRLKKKNIQITSNSRISS